MIPNWPRDAKGRLLPKAALPDDFVPADIEAVKERLHQAKPGAEKPTPKPDPIVAANKAETYELTRYEPSAGLVQQIGDSLGGMFELLARRLGPHWELSQREKDGLGLAYGRLFNKYQQNVAYLPEIMAGVATVGLAGRIMVDTRKLRNRGPRISTKPVPPVTEKADDTAKPAATG